MAKKSKIAKDARRRETVARHAQRRAALKLVVSSPTASRAEREAAALGLQKLPRDASPTRLRNRDVRQRLFQASVDRASSGDHDNGPVAVRIARLRAERARLLGFATHADLVLADQTARTTDAVDTMLASMVPASVANAEKEAAVLGELAARDGVEVAPWDWAFYSEQVRAER